MKQILETIQLSHFVCQVSQVQKGQVFSADWELETRTLTHIISSDSEQKTHWVCKDILQGCDYGNETA